MGSRWSSSRCALGLSLSLFLAALVVRRGEGDDLTTLHLRSQAAGLLTLAHPSAGPLLDILVPSSSPSHGTGPTGFLASSSPPPSPSSPSSSTDPEPPHLAFAASLAHILALPESEQDAVRARARESAQARFGVDAFERGWMDAWGELERRVGATVPGRGAGAQDEKAEKMRE